MARLMGHTAPCSWSRETCNAPSLKINGLLEMSPEVRLVFLIYPILLEVQIRLGFQENNLSTEISGVSGSHLCCHPSLSAPHCCHQAAEGPRSPQLQSLGPGTCVDDLELAGARPCHRAAVEGAAPCPLASLPCRAAQPQNSACPHCSALEGASALQTDGV